MAARAKFIVESDGNNSLVIADVGDHSKVPTVTNDAEAVVADLHESGLLGDKNLYYHDSEGMLDQLLHDGAGTFKGYAPGPGR